MFEDIDLYTLAKLLGVFLVALLVINAFDHLARQLGSGEVAWEPATVLSAVVVLAVVVALLVELCRGQGT